MIWRGFSPFICMAVVLAVSSARAASQIEVGRLWPANQRVSLDAVDHGAWTALLKKHVDAQGFVDYTAWKASAADVQALDAYLAVLSRAEVAGAASRPAKLAFWINAYNAVTIRGILREYPTTSIRNHTAKLFGYNIWDDLLLIVGDRRYSLSQIEHDVLRPSGEWRIHFAIVCASVGCPRLRNEAYTAETIEQQLTANTREFFADRRQFRYDAVRGRMHLSSILKMFAADFGPNQAAQLRTIAPYLPDAGAQQAAQRGDVSVSYLDYDWSLNDQARLRNAARP